MAVSGVAIGTNTPARPYITVGEDDLCAGSLTNIYFEYGSNDVHQSMVDQGNTRMTLAFGDCQTKEVHTVIGSIELAIHKKRGAWPNKFVWAIPEDAQAGCVIAKDHLGHSVAESKPLVISKRRMSKRGHPELEDVYFDAVKFYKTQVAKRGEIHASDKSERIGIVGAGMSGLFSALLLEQAGLHNYEILEANNRLGGRVHTVYFENSTTSLTGNKDSKTYQEMGPMRIPIERTYNNKTLPITDHHIVFLMASELNRLNNNDEEYKIDFIEWIESTTNNLVYKNNVRLANGEIPTKGDIAANLSLTHNIAEDLSEQVAKALNPLLTQEWFELMRSDLYAAHAKAIEEGYDDWSEWGWLHNKIGLSLNATDYATNMEAGSIWYTMYEAFTFDAGTHWRTIQGGLTRLARAYAPLVADKVQFGIRVGKLGFEKGDKVSVQWKKNPYDETYESRMYDNVIVSVPFSLVRSWHLPDLPHTLHQAIHNMNYGGACKIAMEFKTRFWEHYQKPILGGCDDIDLLAQIICYPSNNLLSDGPGVMLASYSSGKIADLFSSMTEEQHVARILEDIKEIHGADLVREQYTGIYTRLCWSNNPLQSGAWAETQAGSHKLYMPSYFEMINGLVFVGEHTDIKNGWISAALESAIRGVVMTLVDRGHIMEAKAIVKKWDAKWMKI